MADNSARIAEIDAILESGVEQSTNDGTTVKHNFAELRKERRRLIENDDTRTGSRPSAITLDLSGFGG